VDGGFVVLCQADGAEYRFGCRSVINAAGLGAQVLAGSCKGLDPVHIPPLYLCKGLYFSLKGKHPFKHLIYPVPEASGAGLGVHATLDLGGRVKFGPNVEYVDEADYSVPEARREDYFQAIRRYYPQIEKARLVPDYAGIRPKLQAPGGQPADFVIQGPSVHGLIGLVNLFGIESPGLTAALAIADYVHTDILGY
jgi:L-2-hydroxyglutarate oxidase LhgO